MKVLITGGAGFIGSALIRYLIKNTDYEVLNYDALKYSGNLNSLKSIEKSKRYSFIHGDIRDTKKLDNALMEFKPNGIMHLAAESHVDRSINNALPFIETNIIGTYSLLSSSYKYLRSLKKDVKNEFTFLHVSTDEVYGDISPLDPPCNESQPYNPSSPYSASKASSDHLVNSWFRTYDFPAVISNCSNNYGPFHFPEKFIPHIILNSIHGKNIPIYGDGQQVRDWIYVDDHVRGLIQVFEKGKHGESYNIGASNEITNIEIANMICEILDKKIDTKPNNINSFKELINFVADRPGHDRRYSLDSSKMKKSIGWMANESFESGLRKTVQWYLENEDWWQEILDGDYILERIGN